MRQRMIFSTPQQSTRASHSTLQVSLRTPQPKVVVSKAPKQKSLSIAAKPLLYKAQPVKNKLFTANLTAPHHPITFGASFKTPTFQMPKQFLHSICEEKLYTEKDVKSVSVKQMKNKILVIKGQGIGPECISATKKVLDATGVDIEYLEGTLGYPDAKDLLTLLSQKAPEIYAIQFGAENPTRAAERLEYDAKQEAKTIGNINDFCKRLLGKLKPEVLKEVKAILFELEKQTLQDAQKASAVLKGALRTLDEGEEPSRNVTIRKALEQYANIRRCITLDPIAPGMKGADILFVRENVEDLYASIEHRLARNYPQALRHQTPEGCELICRAAFEAALRDGRKKVTALEKPNILKITGGLFKETFFSVAKDYSKEKLGEQGIEANFMIIDDGLAAIAATPEKFDVIVTSNMFGDIGSDVAAKVTGGVGLVSSNNTNPSNPKSVSMFETMGGTADDIAGQNKANPVALIDAAAEMLLHIGGKENVLAAEMIKTAILEVLAEGYYVGDIKKGPYQEVKGKEKVGTQEFAAKVAEKVQELRLIKAKHPEKTIKQIALERASEDVQPLLKQALRSYEQYATEMQTGSSKWAQYVQRNIPPNPPRSSSKIIGFDLFVDNSGMQIAFTEDGEIDESLSKIDTEVNDLFKKEAGIDIHDLFNQGKFSSIQSIRSFSQYCARVLRDFIEKAPDKAATTFGSIEWQDYLGKNFASRFSEHLRNESLINAVLALDKFSRHSIKLIQAFYRIRAQEIEPILKEHGFKLVRITSRGTEIYPTMCDFEKRDVDRFRVEIDPSSKLATEGYTHAQIQLRIAQVQAELAKQGWIISETMLNRDFTDVEGPNKGKKIPGVSVPYARNLGTRYDIQNISNSYNSFPGGKPKILAQKTLIQKALADIDTAVKDIGDLLSQHNIIKTEQILLDDFAKRLQDCREAINNSQLAAEEVMWQITMSQEVLNNVLIVSNHIQDTAKPSLCRR